ncbi:MAG: hypothetical protein WC822_06920 [Candidatus Paceibacterota bacterium]|jgi:hypothetical protein
MMDKPMYDIGRSDKNPADIIVVASPSDLYDLRFTGISREQVETLRESIDEVLGTRYKPAKRLIAEMSIRDKMGNKGRLLVYDGGDGSVRYYLMNSSMERLSMAYIASEKYELPLFYTSDTDVIEAVKANLTLSGTIIDKVLHN